MGRDKATLVLPDGRTMARNAYDLLRDAGCETIAVSLRPGQEIPLGLREIAELEIARDADGGPAGPLAGIVAGLRLRPDADWLVIACDLPALDGDSLKQLVAARQPDDKFLAFRSEFDGLPEPLCAIYNADVLPILEGADTASPRRILLENGCRLLDPPQPGALANANTPEDWDALATIPEWHADLLEIWISPGNDFRGRHGLGRLDHGIVGVPRVECVAGMGLRGDRYFGYRPDYKGQVTFFSADVVQAVRDHFARPSLCSADFRRSFIIRGVDFAVWPGRKFRFQGVTFEATEECKPCYWMDEAIAPGTEEFLKPNFGGGLRAKILTDGVLRVS